MYVIICFVQDVLNYGKNITIFVHNVQNTLKNKVQIHKVIQMKVDLLTT